MKTIIPTVWREHDDKVRPYVWKHRWLRWPRTALGLVLLASLLFPPRAQLLEGWVVFRFPNPFLQWLVFFGIIGFFWTILSFPFDWGHQQIERNYGLSKQSFVSWFWDKIKGLLLGLVLGTILMALLYFSVTVFVTAWWAAACTLFVLFSIVLAQLTPVLLIPLFFKLKPMENGMLKDRLLALCQRFGVEVKDVYHLGLGEKTEKGNAAFVGLGRTKRILIGDTLYEKYPAEEVEAVFAHELGHQVHNDLWKGIGLSAALIYLTFFVAQGIAGTWVFPYWHTSIQQPFGLFLFFVVLSLVQIPVGVIQALYSRSRERAADDFAVKTIAVGKPLADALEKLTFQNFSYFSPNALIEFLTYSHPAPARRILGLRG